MYHPTYPCFITSIASVIYWQDCACFTRNNQQEAVIVTIYQQERIDTSIHNAEEWEQGEPWVLDPEDLDMFPFPLLESD